MVRFGEPWALVALIGVAGLLFLGGRRALGRAVTLSLLLLSLAEPEISVRESRELVFVLVDRSASMRGTYADAYRELLPSLRDRRAQVGMVYFGAEPRLALPPTDTPPEGLPPAPHPPDPQGTDIAAAIDLALCLVPEGRPAQLILISDGRSTRGDPYAAAIRARLRGIRLSTVPAGVEDPLIVRGIRGPQEMLPGTAVFTALVSVRAPLSAIAVWRVDGEEARREERDLSPGEHRLSLEVELPEPGLHRISLEISFPGDPFPQNDRAETAVEVGGGARILVAGQGASAVDGLLSGKGVPFRKAPFLDEYALSGVDLLILDDYPLGYISPLLLEELRAFAEAGGGILAILGRGAVEGYLGRVEEILPVGFSVPEELREPSAALVFVLDKSSSMAGRAGTLRKIDILKEAVAAAAETVYGGDFLGALAFDRGVHWLVRPRPAAEAREVLYRTLKGLSPSGGTDLFPPTRAALDALSGVEARVKHIIIVSDGKTVREKDFSVLADRIREEGVGVTAIAIGPNPDLEVLGMLARAGEGDLILVPDLGSLAQVLLRETERALRPRFLQGEFPVRRGPSLLAGELPLPPPLSGYTLTFPKPTAHVVLESEAGDPILSVWRLGLGWVGALTADLAGIWSRGWLDWEGFPELFGRILELVWPSRGPVGLRWSRKGDELELVAEVREGERWVNGLALRGRLVGAEVRAEFVFRQTGPGRYEAAIPLPPAGAYSVTVSDAEGRYGGTFAIPIPYPAEYEQLGPDPGALGELAALGGGKMLTDELLPPSPGVGRRWFPLRRALLLLSGLAFLSDLAWRKLPH